MTVLLCVLLELQPAPFPFPFQVANFGSAEDDGSFWSRWIKPEAIAQAEV